MTDLLNDWAAELLERGCDLCAVREATARIRRLYGGSTVYVTPLDDANRERTIQHALDNGARRIEAERLAGVVHGREPAIRRKRSTWLIADDAEAR